jgi:excisionase family DNA binding protein
MHENENNPESVEATGVGRVQWLTLAEAARQIGVARTALYQWLQAGRVPHHRFGRLIKIHPDDLEKFVASVRAEGIWTPYVGAAQG